MRVGKVIQVLGLTLLVPGTFLAQTATQPSLCSDWKAWRSSPPSGPAILHVTALCQLPTPAHRLKLVPATPQGSDATVLVLDEVLHAPEGMVAQVITPFKLHYRKKTSANCKEVVINPEGKHVTVSNSARPASASPTPDK